MDLYEKVRNLAQADFQSNGCYANAPYRIHDGGEVYIGRVAVNKEGEVRVKIERPVKEIGSVNV